MNQNESPSAGGISSLRTLTDLQGTIRLLLARWHVIAACLAFMLILATVFVIVSPRKYEATATIEVQQRDQKIFKDNAIQAIDAKSVEILNTIAEKLNNPALLEQVLVTNHRLPPTGDMVTNASGVAVSRQKFIETFSSSVKPMLRHNTFLIDVAVRDRDPEMAAKLANSVITCYLEQDAMAEQRTAELSVAPLQQEADKLMSKLEASEKDLQNYRKEVRSVSLDQNQDIVTPELQSLSHMLSLNEAGMIQAKVAYEDALNMGTNVERLLAYPQIANDPKVQQISTALASLESDFIQIRQRYREKHPKYILAVTSLQGLQNQLTTTVQAVGMRIQESLRITYQGFVDNEAGLQVQMTNAENQALELGDASVHFHALTRKVASDRAVYDDVINEVGETAVSAQVTPEKIRVVALATPSETPVSPKKKLFFALAIFGGLVFGFGLSFTLHTLDTSFQTADDIEQTLELQVLGAIPKLTSKAKGNKPVLLDAKNAQGVESFRTLRASVAMLNRGKGAQEKRVLLFASSLPDEGKTFISVNHAVSLAQQGQRTLLIDGDLRKPAVEKFFSKQQISLPGVTDYFKDGHKIPDLCYPAEGIGNLLWMPAGTKVSHPSELLAGADFKKLLAEALLHFDRIIIDTAPLLPVSDTMLIADKVDAVLLVVQSGKTPRSAVQRSLRLLHQAGAPIDGIVLNMMPGRVVNSYYYGYNYGQGYGNNGDKNGKKSAVLPMRKV